MEVNKKQLADIFGASVRTIQNWQEQGMPVLRGGGKGNEVLYDSAAVIKWYAERDAEIENEKLRREVEELRQASETDLQPGTIASHKRGDRISGEKLRHVSLMFENNGNPCAAASVYDVPMMYGVLPGAYFILNGSSQGLNCGNKANAWWICLVMRTE